MNDRIRVRLKFKKYGCMKFIGHLDVMRYFQKLIRRSEVDVAYSEGFHPHQLLSFANPLGVGIESEGEYADIVLKSFGNSEDTDGIVRQMNRFTVEGFEITGAAVLPENAGNGMASVAMADYLVELEDKAVFDEAFLSGICDDTLKKDEVFITKKSKKGETRKDIRGGIHELCCKGSGRVFMRLSAGSVLNIRPEQVMGAMLEMAGRASDLDAFSITRLEQYDNDGRSLLFPSGVQDQI